MRSLIARKPAAPKSDPAPSRWAWRIERWMLTPGVRLGLRAGIPLCVSFMAGAIYLSDEGRRTEITDTVAAFRASIEERPEFMVNLMSVTGASDDVSAEIRDILPVDLPSSSFDLDLEALRETIAGLDPVKSASVRIRPGGVLEVKVTERIPVLVWRTYDRVALLDATGAHVAVIPTRLARPELPLIAGEGADLHVAEALDLIRAARPLGDRLRGLVRMGERRWDVVLDREQRILLPEHGAQRALERAIALDNAKELLTRDVAQIDLRLGDRPTVQMTKDATEEWFHIRAQNSATGQN
ncbi:MAG: cell division protein FtsQ/DivIB [Aliishimia sp.]